MFDSQFIDCTFHPKIEHGLQTHLSSAYKRICEKKTEMELENVQEYFAKHRDIERIKEHKFKMKIYF